jgi:hypothetical protein
MNQTSLREAGLDVEVVHLRTSDSKAYRDAATRALAPGDNDGGLGSGTIIHPEPHRGVYRSNAGIIVPSAVELWNLLHFEHAKAVLQSNGQYKGQRIAVTHEALERHLAGEVTLGFTVLHYKLALYVALDVDARFSELLPFIRAAVLKVGGEDLLAAIFCTNGSDDRRGKVVVTFTQPVAATVARKLVQQLCRRVRASEPAQDLQRNELSAYPHERSGGLVRILGRNVGRGGPIEAPFSLDGEPGLSHVRPLTRVKLAAIVASFSDNLAPWARRRIETPWVRREGTAKHFGHMVALAREAIRIYGRGRGFRHYDEWLEMVRANSPELSLPSLKTKDSRNVIEHSRKTAWDYACKNPNSWEPLELQVRKGIPRGAVRAYNLLVGFVRRNGLRPDRFGIDYERSGVLFDTSKSTAHRWVKCAAKAGVVVIHDRGRRHTKGAPGKCVQLGLVCRGQTPDQVRAVRTNVSSSQEEAPIMQSPREATRKVCLLH